MKVFLTGEAAETMACITAEGAGDLEEFETDQERDFAGLKNQLRDLRVGLSVHTKLIRGWTTISVERCALLPGIQRRKPCQGQEVSANSDRIIPPGIAPETFLQVGSGQGSRTDQDP
jgi:hypothetical protein